MGTLRCTTNHAGLIVNGVTLGDPVAPAWFTYDDPRIPNGQIADDGQITVYDQATLDSPAAAANRETLRTQAAAALAANKTALAVANPTNAQVVAQVKALTRQNNALIRLLLGLLDGTD